MMDECEAYSELDQDRREVILIKEYGAKKYADDRTLWSYKFPVKDLDEYQISVPNEMNHMPQLENTQRGW